MSRSLKSHLLSLLAPASSVNAMSLRPALLGEGTGIPDDEDVLVIVEVLVLLWLERMPLSLF